MEQIKKFFGRDEVRNRLRELLGSRSTQFISSVLYALNKSDDLQKAEINSIYNATIMAAIINLPLNDNLDYAYIVPYAIKNKDGTRRLVAQFQMGYKGYIQLAIRTDMYKTIGAAPIYQGQLVQYDPLAGHVFDFSKPSSGNPIGYASYFELLTGYMKNFYMSVDEVRAHGRMYSKTYRNNSGLWVSNFDVMATKTVIKLNLKRYAPMSIDLQRAMIADGAVINDAEALDVTYVDNDNGEGAGTVATRSVNKKAERLAMMIDDATTVEALEQLRPHVTGDQMELFNNKLNQLTEKTKSHERPKDSVQV